MLMEIDIFESRAEKLAERRETRRQLRQQKIKQLLETPKTPVKQPPQIKQKTQQHSRKRTQTNHKPKTDYIKLGKKHCPHCQTTKPIEEYRYEKSKKQPHCYCKPCERQKSRERWNKRKAELEANPNKPKKCNKCGETKLAADFFNTWHCASCHKNYANSRYQAKVTRNNYSPRPHINGQKECAECKTLKPLAEYGKLTRSWDGLNGRCKPCSRFIQNQYYKPVPRLREPAPDGHKYCPRCKTNKLFEEFGYSKHQYRNLTQYCLVCKSELNRFYRQRAKARKAASCG